MAGTGSTSMPSEHSGFRSCMVCHSIIATFGTVDVQNFLPGFCTVTKVPLTALRFVDTCVKQRGHLVLLYNMLEQIIAKVRAKHAYYTVSAYNVLSGRSREEQARSCPL